MHRHNKTRHAWCRVSVNSQKIRKTNQSESIQSQSRSIVQQVDRYHGIIVREVEFPFPLKILLGTPLRLLDHVPGTDEKDGVLGEIKLIDAHLVQLLTDSEEFRRIHDEGEVGHCPTPRHDVANKVHVSIEELPDEEVSLGMGTDNESIADNVEANRFHVFELLNCGNGMDQWSGGDPKPAVIVEIG